MNLGCNYWSSNAGLRIWEDFDESVIDDDFRLIAEHGMNMIRIFPMWHVFMPVKAVYGPDQQVIYYENTIIKEEFLVMFKTVLTLARKHNLKVIVPLITGWMSGRLFLPEAFNNVNLITDRTAIRYQVSFIKQFIERFKDDDIIVAWGLGNECNVMGEVADSNESWHWMYTMTSAIRQSDSTRPIYSDMHGMTIDGNWKLFDQKETVDVMTTHPYPVFTPYCDLDKLINLRGALHAIAESAYYRDLTGKPCIIEEVGSLGPMILSEELEVKYLRTLLFECLNENIDTVLWWCAFDQDKLDFPPYSFSGLERNLGLFRSNKQPKPTAEYLKEFRTFIDQYQFESLPSQKDGVLLLSYDQNHWQVAYGGYILASQADLKITYSHVEDELPDSNLYLLPCASGHHVIKKVKWDQLINRVKEGATLYISYEDGFISDFKEVTGYDLKFRNDLIKSDDHTLYHNKLGKGNVYFTKQPIEKMTLENSEFIPNTIYRDLKMKNEVMTVSDPLIKVNVKKISETESLAILINYHEQEKKPDFTMNDEYEIVKVLYGELNLIKDNDALIMHIRKK
ncbi:MAG: cellulase family glycosylhydrolase [Clostridia bacterium]|nr:cellulase family glycosylhydrolase [Clostridia bacterium]